jgi:hypothetical protein
MMDRFPHRFRHADLLGPREAASGLLPLRLPLEEPLYVSHPEISF